MAALGVTAATDIANAALIWYVKGKTLSQTTQDKPFLKWLRDNKKQEISSGNKQISIPVQFAYMSDTPGFVQGFAGDDSITFNATSNIVRAVYTWYEVVCSLWITWTDLLIDGITMLDDTKGGKQVEHSQATQTRITGILENRMDDFGESYSRGMNAMFWGDGSQDAKQVPGILALLKDVPTGTVGGLSQTTYPLWRNRVNLTLVPSPANSTIIQFFNTELLQLKRFGGRPNKALCGSSFLDALRSELFAKGYFTQTGYQNSKATDLGMGGIHISGMGMFDYDPTLDSIGFAKRCYVLASNDIKWQPIEGEEDKILTPERPYQYLVFLHNVKNAGALAARRLNSCGVYSVQ